MKANQPKPSTHKLPYKLLLTLCLLPNLPNPPHTLALQPHPTPPSLPYIQKLYKQKKYRQAAHQLQRLLQHYPQHPQALLWRAKVAYKEMDILRGKQALQKLLQISPKNFDAHIYMTYFLLYQKKYHQALQHAKTAKTIQPKNYRAYLAYSNVLLRLKKVKQALKLTKKAKRLQPKNARIYALLGHIYYRLYRPQKAKYYFQKALRLNPLQPMALWYLGCGLGPPSSNHPLQKPNSQKLLQHLKQALQYNQYHQALQYAKKLTQRHPKNATARFLLALCLKRQAYSYHLVYSLPAFQKLQKLLYTSPKSTPPYLPTFLPNYPQLQNWEKQLLLYSILPLKKYMPRLIQQNIVHHLLPIDQRLSQIPTFQYIAKRFTKDGRRMADLRGLSFKNAVTGRETLWNAKNFHFNTFAHELAHQIHTFALSNKQKSQIQKLYQKAKKYSRFLDYYAASNVYEYFAQGYEAFLSRWKQPGLPITAGHTREELRQKDPELFHFLQQLTTPTLTSQQLSLIYWQIAKLQFQLGYHQKFLHSSGIATLLSWGYQIID